MPQPRSANPLDDEIVRVYKETSPSSAYLLGWNEYAGKLFIPSEARIKAALAKVRALKSRARTDVQKKVLNSMETTLLFDEPQPVLDDVVGTIFGHLTKEGLNVAHMQSLLSDAYLAIEETAQRFTRREVPAAVRALTLYRLNGIIEILDSVKNATKDGRLKDECDRVKEKAKQFVEMFKLEGFGEGTFDDIERVFRKYRFELGREKFYPDALKNALDYNETPEELEQKALAWLDDELPDSEWLSSSSPRSMIANPRPRRWRSSSWKGVNCCRATW